MRSHEFPPPDRFTKFLDRVLDGRGEWGDRTVATGLWDLDGTLAGGLRVGGVSLVGGIAGVGTSMFCLGIARRAALVDRLRTVVIAPDTAEEHIFARILSAEARIPLNQLLAGPIAPEDIAKVRRKWTELVEAPIYVSSNWPQRATSAMVAADVEEWVACGAQFLVVDGTSQVEPSTRELIRDLKAIAQRTNATILVASKVIMPEGRRADWPAAEDFREYQSTADLVDLILGLHRPDMHDFESTRPGEADVEILKHRHGPTRRVAVAFQGHYARFVDLA